MKIKIPIRTESEANAREHWAKAHTRHKAQKNATKLVLAPRIDETWLPCEITLRRIAPRKFDKSDNLPTSFKYILDAVCELLVPGKAVGRADGDNRIQVKYEQIKGIPREYAIEVEIVKLCY